MLKKLIVVILFIAIPLAVMSDEAKEEDKLEIGDPAPKFTLKDADDKEYSLEKMLEKDEKFGEKIVMLMMGDQKVRKQANKWATEFHKLYGENKNIVMIMIADLRGLPFFVTEGMVKWGTKRENLPIPIILDWEGKISQKYQTERGKPNLRIVDNHGKIAYIKTGEYSEKLVKEIHAKVQEILEKAKACPDENSADKDEENKV
jgi:hypothetical protein